MRSARKALILSLLLGGALVALLSWPPAKAPRRAAKEPLVVYCAAGLKPPVEAVARDYEKTFGRTVQIQYGGSGTLLSNLRVAGKGDLFLAADETYLDLARSNRLLAEVIPLARMVPVLAVPRGNPKTFRALPDLLRADVNLALANPDAAAVGKITRELLQRSGDWPALEGRIKVFKPTVNDVANDIKLGTVDAGIIWDATASQYPELEAVPLPVLAAGETQVCIGVLQCSAQSAAALHFARYLGARDKGLREFARAGYRPVEGDVWADRPEVVLYSGGVNRLAIEDTLRQFEAREGVSVLRVYNGCGILVSQIKSGQRPDAFFACDRSFLREVNDQFLHATDVSETDLVLLIAKGNPKGLRSLADLSQPGLKLGLGNPQQTALGALTAKALQAAGLHDAIIANVKAQTPTADLLVNQMRTGSLDAAIVFEANTAQVRDHLDVVRLEQPLITAIQPYAVGRNSNHRLLMERLLAVLRSSQARQDFESAGFRWREEGRVP